MARAHLGPDTGTAGRVPSIVATLLRSPLAERYRLEAIPTYRDGSCFSREGTAVADAPRCSSGQVIVVNLAKPCGWLPSTCFAAPTTRSIADGRPIFSAGWRHTVP